jgi:hypothetical protein
MAKLVIKDLTDSVELDRQAMAAIVGGARIGVPGSARVFDYPPGFPAAHQTIADVPAATAPRNSPRS